MATRQFAANEWIFREGEDATHCYLLQSGKVQLTRNTGQGFEPISVINAGECFGEIAILENLAHYGSGAQVLEDCVVEALTMEVFHLLIHQCPQVLLPLFASAFEQLKRVALRASTAATQQVRLDGIQKVLLRAGSEALTHAVPHTLEVMLSRLPYKIGGYPENGEINSVDNNNVYLPCKTTPMLISRQHCQIEAAGEQLIVLDLGSRFGTIVNDVPIGRGRGLYKAPLSLGHNSIQLGGPDSPYSLTVIIE